MNTRDVRVDLKLNALGILCLAKAGGARSCKCIAEWGWTRVLVGSQGY